MKRIPLFLLWLLALTACSDAERTNEKESTTVAGTKTAPPDENTTPVRAQLDEAKSMGKVAFFVLVSNDTTGNSQALAVAGRVTKLVENSVMIKVNRDDTANAAVIEKWQLSSIPTPAIFIISPKGIPVTSFSLEEANESDIISYIPSPKMDDAFVALDEKKPVFILVAGKSATDKEKIKSSCIAANELLKIKAALIEVDQDDPKEKRLLDKFEIPSYSTTPTVVVLNAEGETTGTFKGSVTTKQLVTAATKVITTPCCANGETCK